MYRRTTNVLYVRCMVDRRHGERGYYCSLRQECAFSSRPSMLPPTTIGRPSLVVRPDTLTGGGLYVFRLSATDTTSQNTGNSCCRPRTSTLDPLVSLTNCRVALIAKFRTESVRKQQLICTDRVDRATHRSALWTREYVSNALCIAQVPLLTEVKPGMFIHRCVRGGG